MKLSHILSEKISPYQISLMKADLAEVKRELKDARAWGESDDHIASLEQKVKDLQDEIEHAIQSQHPLREAAPQDSLAPIIDALAKRVSRFILANAQHDWQQNKNRYISRDGYTDFADWFNVDYLGNSYNVDSVIDNLGASIKRQVITALQAPQNEAQ